MLSHPDRRADADGAYFAARLGLPQPEAGRLAERVLGVTVFPTLLHALFGLAPVVETMPDEAALDTDIDLDLELGAFEVATQLRGAYPQGLAGHGVGSLPA